VKPWSPKDWSKDRFNIKDFYKKQNDLENLKLEKKKRKAKRKNK
jgi:hypothetical protein